MCLDDADLTIRRTLGSRQTRRERSEIELRCIRSSIRAIKKTTGPRTPEGLERSRRARWKHGAYSRKSGSILRAFSDLSRR